MREEFLKRLVILATIYNYTLDEYQIGLYETNLKERGYEWLCKAVEDMILDKNSYPRFPSVRDFQKKRWYQLVENGIYAIKGEPNL